MRPIQKTLLYASTNATGVSTLQTPAYRTTAAAILQTLTGSNTPIVLNGIYATGGVVTFPAASKVSFTSASNFSGTTFTITGTDAFGAPQVVTRAGPNNNTVSTTATFRTISSITSNSSGYTTETISVGASSWSTLLINGTFASGGVATLVVPAILNFTTGDNMSGWSLTVYGTDANGVTIYETLDTPNATTASTTLEFKTVTAIIIDNTAAFSTETMSAGNAAAGDAGLTDWWPLDIYGPNQVTTISVNEVSGDATYSVEYTNEDPFDTSITQLAWPHPAAALAGATTDQVASTTTLMRAVRVNASAGYGELRVTVTQQSTA